MTRGQPVNDRVAPLPVLQAPRKGVASSIDRRKAFSERSTSQMSVTESVPGGPQEDMLSPKRRSLDSNMAVPDQIEMKYFNPKRRSITGGKAALDAMTTPFKRQKSPSFTKSKHTIGTQSSPVQVLHSTRNVAKKDTEGISKVTPGLLQSLRMRTSEDEVTATTKKDSEIENEEDFMKSHEAFSKVFIGVTKDLPFRANEGLEPYVPPLTTFLLAKMNKKRGFQVGEEGEYFFADRIEIAEVRVR